MYKYILFDLDGTITESAPGIMNSARYALKHFGIEAPTDEKLRKFVGPPLFESFTQMFGIPVERANEAISTYREYYAVKGIFENEVYEGVPEMLKRLVDGGYTVALATSKPEVYARKILAHFGLDCYFTEICGIPLEDEKMTKAQVIATCIEKLGSPNKSQILMVGDRDYDVKGATQNGIDCMGVLFGYGDREELESAGAVMIAKSARDVDRLIMNE